MRILIKRARVQLYVQGRGTWTADPYEAHDFQHSQHAIDFAREHGLTGVGIAVRFLDAEFDEVFPIPMVATATQQFAHG